MKTLQDLKLEQQVSGPILDLVRDAIDGEFNDLPNGDVQSIVEALAMNIITTVKESI